MHEKVITQIQVENNQLKAQLLRLDDVEGMVQVIHEKGNCCQTLNESKGIAIAVINYIKGV